MSTSPAACLDRIFEDPEFDAGELDRRRDAPEGGDAREGAPALGVSDGEGGDDPDGALALAVLEIEEQRPDFARGLGAPHASGELRRLPFYRVESTSPGELYHDADWRNRYVLEVTDTLGASLAGYARWGDSVQATPAWCRHARLRAAFVGYRPLGDDGGRWEIIAEGMAERGRIAMGGIGEIELWWSIADCPYSKLRVAGRASLSTILCDFPRRVTVGVQFE